VVRKSPLVENLAQKYLKCGRGGTGFVEFGF